MVNTFVRPTTTSGTKLDLNVSFFNETSPAQLHENYSDSDAELVIRAIYRQVLGNAYVMESERLITLESQLKGGQLSVRGFVRQLAKSSLYRSRFFENCYRYRAIELNFKHLLGRAPNSYEEMYSHSNTLDKEGFEADIDTYLDSEEYYRAFGEFTVPYYQGYQTRPGRSVLEFTNMLQLLRGASSSDKNVVAPNKPVLTHTLIKSSDYAKPKAGDVDALIAEALRPKSVVSLQNYSWGNLVDNSVAISSSDVALQQTIQEQAQEIKRLQQQLTNLSSVATIGSSVSNSDWQPSSTLPGDKTATSASLQEQADTQEAQIKSLRGKLADTQCFAAVGEAYLNKWRSRTFSR